MWIPPQVLPQRMAAKIVRNTAPSRARIVRSPTAKGRWQPSLVMDFHEGVSIAVLGKTGEALRKWSARHGVHVEGSAA